MQETDFIKPNRTSPENGPLNSNSSFIKPYVIGVAGGSGSGKTYFAKALKLEFEKNYGQGACEIVFQDNFYRDQSKHFDRDGGTVNFDHPDSIDFLLLAEHVKKLKSGLSTEIPIYDFSTHTRKNETLLIQPTKIIIVDGILIFHSEIVRCLFDDLIFFETPEELRYTRRLERDVKERGRSVTGVQEQFFKQVKPMHDRYVEPSMVFAKIIVKDFGDFNDFLEAYCLNLKQMTKI